MSIHSHLLARLSLYTPFIEIYKQEMYLAAGTCISASILLSIYLYIQSRHKAELLFIGTANTLNAHIAAVSGEIEAHKCSLAVELDDLKRGMNAQKDDLDELKGIIDAQSWELVAQKGRSDTQEEGLDGLKGGLDAQNHELAILRGVVEAQKGELSTLRGVMDAQRVVLQRDINRILAWLGTSPYLANAATESLRQSQPWAGYNSHRNPARPGTVQQNQDISETSMRKTIDMAFPR